MIATLVGFRPINFTDDNGRQISGTSLYIVYESGSTGVYGQEAGKVFYTGSLDASWIGQAIKLEYACNPVAKTMRLVGVSLAD